MPFLTSIRLYPKIYIDKNIRSIDGENRKNPCYLLDHTDLITVITTDMQTAEKIKDSYAEYSLNLFTIPEFLFYLADTPWTGLELGPLCDPCLFGKNVKYVDVVDADGLRKIAEHHKLPVSKCPKRIHYVLPDGNWNEIHDQFDLIYSSHCTEHQTDLIRHLQQISMHLNTDGKYLIVIPDKRFCFDYFKSETTMIDVLCQYYTRATRHSLRAMFNTLKNTHNDAFRHWGGDHGVIPTTTNEQCERTYETYCNSITGDYVDCHEWQFTPDGFCKIIYTLNGMGLIDLEVVDCHITEKNDCSFYVVLKKQGGE